MSKKVKWVPFDDKVAKAGDEIRIVRGGHQVRGTYHGVTTTSTSQVPRAVFTDIRVGAFTRELGSYGTTTNGAILMAVEVKTVEIRVLTSKNKCTGEISTVSMHNRYHAERGIPLLWDKTIGDSLFKGTYTVIDVHKYEVELA